MTGTGLALASSSISYQWTYDVFINFRGEDTRYDFTKNLHKALDKVGVCSFFDDDDLRLGHEIKPALLNAIENSRMAITVFSRNYASSTFCLDELVQIHECIKRKGRLVLPIFYDVEPSEVRHQMGNYKTDLSKHMEKHRADEDKIKRWKLALKEVADISGLHFIPRKNGYECEFIEKIVKEISSKINRVPLHVSEYPVGLESRVKEITSLLQIGGSIDKVIMVGICGMGGLGKTTIARALYNSIADNFEGLCFLYDVKEKSKKLGLEGIQEVILSEIVGVDIKIQDVNAGVEVIKKRFKEKKILLILDNIDKLKQLKNLAGGCNWFSPGSRIIITTRDEQLLVAHGVESRYNLEVFNDKESLELLSWNAFRNRQVDPSYKDVLNHTVTYAQGLPLALEVLGSNLCGKTINEWESALDTYKLSPHKDIQQVLRLSYEVLDGVQKEIFLDIACFFNGEHLEYVKYLAEAVYDCGNLSYAIRVLVDKSLIKIESCDRIQMHDLIRDMGRQIVCEESLNHPGERSRLWIHQNIVDVLECNTGTNKVRMIVQDNWRECIKVDWDGKAFKSMKEVRIIIFLNVKFSEGPKYLPKSLKVLKWRGYPSSCFPPDFSPKKLVVLDVGLSYLSSLETIKTSYNLGILNLEACECVKEIPDLSNLRNLKKLSLMDCKNLIEMHDSIGYLPKLEILDVGGCVRLKNFPRAIKLPSLRELFLSGCSSLTYFPEILEKVKLKQLFLSKTGIEKLPWSICNLPELRALIIFKEKSVIFEIPNSIFLLPLKRIELDCAIIDRKVISCNSIERQEHAIWSKQCPSGDFNLIACNISDDVLRTDVSRFMNVLWSLNLSSSNFTILPAWMKECHFLKRLYLNECKHLREVEGIPPNIELLEARNCVSLSSESKTKIVSEGLQRREPFSFWVPSRSIPNWFKYRSKEGSVSFWFRNSFPHVCLCLLLKPGDYGFNVVRVDINGEEAGSYGLSYMPYAVDDHLFGQRVSQSHIRAFNKHPLHLEDGWYHAQVCMSYISDKGGVLEEIGMYVVEQLCEVKDFSFTNPYQTVDFTWGNQSKKILFSLILCGEALIDMILNKITICRPSAEQVVTRMEEKEVAVNKKRGLMGDDNFASSSTAFICTKRARNSPINQDDNDSITPRVPFVKALEIINNIPGNSIEDDKWLSLRPCWETPFYDESANHQEFQQQKYITSTDVEQVPKTFEDTRKAKGKEIVIYEDTINE